MKKLITLILTLALSVIACFGLTACGGTTYKDLKIIEVGGETESFGIAFRKGSNLTRMVENAIAELEDEGVLATLAETYGVAGVTNYTPAAAENAGSTDFATITANGKLVVGITDYKPMDYKEEGSSEWVGFDADLARAVGQKLNIAIEFKEIEWDNKILDLNAGRIDCVWNGMTITNEILAAADVSVPYMENRQVAVVLKSNAEKYASIDKMTGVRVAAESGSAGETFIKNSTYLKDGLVSVTAQSDAFLEVMSGKSEIAIVDYMMAKALIEG
ncbi:MAG: transporter substrate-binding domain-containing protein [Clostridia bacterium]|nr:transporter substrate-binding domain-containing protein [Clostridia bacterium]